MTVENFTRVITTGSIGPPGPEGPPGPDGPIGPDGPDGLAGTPTVYSYTGSHADIEDDFAAFLIDAAGGTATITLGTLVANRMRVIKKVDSSGNTVIIDTVGAETIDEANTYVLTAQYETVTVICDGSNWWVI